MAQGWRGAGGGTAPGVGDGAALRAQVDSACGAQTRGERAAWREAVLTGGSYRGVMRCRVIGCVPSHRRSRHERRALWNTSTT